MPQVTGFDITAAAQSYSAIAGILAGFVFAILVWLIERLITPEKRDPDTESFVREALIFLGVTFLANVVTSVLWALVSGETDPNTNRPTILSFFATLNFALVSPLTVVSIVFVIAATRIRRVIPVFRWIFFISVVIALFYLWITTTDLLVIQTRSDFLAALRQNLLYLALVLLLTITPILAGWRINSHQMEAAFGWERETSFNRFVAIWLFGILASTIGFGLVGVLEPNRYLPLWLILAADFFWAIMMGWAITFLPVEPQREV